MSYYRGSIWELACAFGGFFTISPIHSGILSMDQRCRRFEELAFGKLLLQFWVLINLLQKLGLTRSIRQSTKENAFSRDVDRRDKYPDMRVLCSDFFIGFFGIA